MPQLKPIMNIPVNLLFRFQIKDDIKSARIETTETYRQYVEEPRKNQRRKRFDVESVLDEFAVVEKTHPFLQAFLQKHLKSGNGAIENFIQILRLSRGKVLQHITGDVGMGRTIDPNAEPEEFRAAQLLDDGAEAIVAAMSTPLLKFETAKGYIKLVVKDNDLSRGDFMKPGGLGYGPPGEVHESLRFQEDDLVTLPVSLPAKAGKGLPGNRDID
jgi:hypothetical protein